MHAPFGLTLRLIEHLQKYLDSRNTSHMGLDELAGVQARIHADAMALCERWMGHCPHGLQLGSGLLASPMQPQAALIQDGRLFAGEPNAWQNWAATAPKVTLGRSFTPVHRAEVEAIVQAAAQSGRRLRAVGHAHTWTPVFPDDSDTDMLYTRALLLEDGHRIRVLERANVAAGRGALVQVSAGVTTGELAAWFDDEGAEAVGHTGLPSDAIINTIRHGGSLGMLCHGTGQHHSDIASFVESLTVVTAAGTARAYTAADAEWPVIRGNFGLCGIVTDVTYRLDNNFAEPYVQVHNDFTTTMGYYFGAADTEHCTRLKSLVLDNYAVELFWQPPNLAELPNRLDIVAGLGTKHFMRTQWDPYRHERMWTGVMQRRAAAAQSDRLQPGSQTYIDGAEPLQDAETRLGGIVSSFAQHTGWFDLQVLSGVLAFIILHVENSIGYLRDGVKTLSRAIHWQQAIDNYPVNDFELCFKVAPDFSNVLMAWRAAVNIAAAELREGRSPLNVALECRFTRGSSQLMSAAYHGGVDDGSLYCWMEVLSSRHTPQWDAFVHKIFTAWTSINHPAPPRPHWAKWNAPSDPNTTDFVTEYAQVAYFEQIRAFRPFVLHADPSGVFRNRWLTRLFHLDSSTAS